MTGRMGIAPLQGAFAEDFRILAAAEAAGFDSAWATGPAGYIRMAAYICNTTRLRIGTGAVIHPTLNPLVHAAAARDLADLSGGRAIVGVGPGFPRQLSRDFGIAMEASNHPLPRMREFLTLLRELLDSNAAGPIRFEGRFFNLTSFRMRTESPPPIYVGAVSPAMLRLAGELADGIVGHPVYSPKYLTDVVRPSIEAGLAKSGRQRDAFDLTRYVLTSVNEDSALARRDVATMLGFLLSPKSYDAVFDACGWEEEKVTVREVFRSGDFERFNEVVPDRLVDACCIYGTPDEARDMAKAYDGLVDHLIYYSPVQDVPRDRVVANFQRIVETFGR